MIRFLTELTNDTCTSVYFVGTTMADEVIWGELNTIRIPWKSHTFDAVLADTTFVSKGRVSECLAEGGLFIDNK